MIITPLLNISKHNNILESKATRLFRFKNESQWRSDEQRKK